MPDMIPSEATTAGAIRQSVDGTKRCPRCGAPLEGRNPFLPSYGRYECGSYERDDTATADCLRRQLAQAQERERAALVREAWLRRVVEDAQSAPQRAQEWMRANGVQVADPSVPMQRAVFEVYNLLVELAQQAEAALADAPDKPENPYAAVVEAEREVIEAAKAWLASGRAEKAKNDAGQDDWYSAHADVCNRLMDAVDALNNLGGDDDG